MRVVVHPEARAELRAAALWYDEQRPGLGNEFVAEVSAMFDEISERPATFAAWPGRFATPASIRRAVLKRFPYAVAFEPREALVRVLAVAHVKRRPLYWLTRAS